MKKIVGLNKDKEVLAIGNHDITIDVDIQMLEFLDDLREGFIEFEFGGMDDIASIAIIEDEGEDTFEVIHIFHMGEEEDFRRIVDMKIKYDTLADECDDLYADIREKEQEMEELNEEIIDGMNYSGDK